MSTSLQSPLAAASTSTAQTIPDTAAALRFITCGSVDDGKSTLIGRLLLDSRAVLQDQLRNVTHQGSGQEFRQPVAWRTPCPGLVQWLAAFERHEPAFDRTRPPPA